MIVGIPNVGKSTFINSFAGKACTKTGNKPGVTKGKQWIRLNKQVELLDTPVFSGLNLKTSRSGSLIALIGSIKDELLQSVELALELIPFLVEEYPGTLSSYYQLQEEGKPTDILLAIARSRGCVKTVMKPIMTKLLFCYWTIFAMQD